jgi:polyhydroxyalkanoate synthesis regulator phasin
MAEFYYVQWGDLAALKSEITRLKERVQKLESSEYGTTMELERLKSKLVDV